MRTPGRVCFHCLCGSNATRLAIFRGFGLFTLISSALELIGLVLKLKTQLHLHLFQLLPQRNMHTHALVT